MPGQNCVSSFSEQLLRWITVVWLTALVPPCLIGNAVQAQQAREIFSQYNQRLADTFRQRPYYAIALPYGKFVSVGDTLLAGTPTTLRWREDCFGEQFPLPRSESSNLPSVDEFSVQDIDVAAGIQRAELLSIEANFGLILQQEASLRFQAGSHEENSISDFMGFIQKLENKDYDSNCYLIYDIIRYPNKNHEFHDNPIFLVQSIFRGNRLATMSYVSKSNVGGAGKIDLGALKQFVGGLGFKAVYATQRGVTLIHENNNVVPLAVRPFHVSETDLKKRLDQILKGASEALNKAAASDVQRAEKRQVILSLYKDFALDTRPDRIRRNMFRPPLVIFEPEKDGNHAEYFEFVQFTRLLAEEFGF